MLVTFRSTTTDISWLYLSYQLKMIPKSYEVSLVSYHYLVLVSTLQESKDPRPPYLT